MPRNPSILNAPGIKPAQRCLFLKISNNKETNMNFSSVCRRFGTIAPFSRLTLLRLVRTFCISPSLPIHTFARIGPSISNQTLHFVICSEYLPPPPPAFIARLLLDNAPRIRLSNKTISLVTSFGMTVPWRLLSNSCCSNSCKEHENTYQHSDWYIFRTLSNERKSFRQHACIDKHEPWQRL